MALPRSFQNLVENLTILPGVGEKTAERYVYALYEKEDDDVEALAKALINFKKNIKTCAICGCLSDETKCEVCMDNSRDKSTICVVEDSKNVFFFFFKGTGPHRSPHLSPKLPSSDKNLFFLCKNRGGE